MIKNKIDFEKLNKIVKTNKEPVAIVLGSYITTGLGAIRNLGRKGIKTILLDSKSRQICFCSRYCVGFSCPDLKKSEIEYINFLKYVGENLPNKGVLFPTSDIELVTILKFRRDLEPFFDFPMADFDIVNKMIDKRSFYRQLEKCNITHPTTYFPENIQDLSSIGGEIKYPCIVKPSFSEEFHKDFNLKVFTAKTKEELIKWYELGQKKNHKMMIQEIIPGNADCMYGFNAYYNKKFRPMGCFTYRRIREWPHTFGNGCFIESVVKPELEEIINLFIKNIRYYGIVDAEFKIDPRNGAINLIEINPRLWMQNSLPARCGANHAFIAYSDITGKPIKNGFTREDNVKWLYMFEDLFSSQKNISNKRLFIIQWLKSFRGKKEYCIFAWDDPLPFILFWTVLFFSAYKYIKLNSRYKN